MDVKKLILVAMCLFCGCALTPKPQVIKYGAAKEVCHQLELRVADREHSTQEDDERDIRTIRAVCDQVLHSIETSGDEK